MIVCRIGKSFSQKQQYDTEKLDKTAFTVLRISIMTITANISIQNTNTN